MIHESKQKLKTPFKITVAEYAESIIMALILAIVIRTFVVQAFMIPTTSMEPTLIGDARYGDKILVSKFAYIFGKPERGDIVVFSTKGIRGLEQNKEYIKRAVGLPGEEVLIKYGEVFVDGAVVRHPFIFNKIEYFNTPKSQGPYGVKNEPVTVPENSYFMLGDNSANSRDSRYWGFAPAGNIKGKAFLIWAPIKRWTMLK